MDFKTISLIVFQNKRNWSDVTDKDKDTVFFIFNRYMAKKFPKQANQFNLKGIDKATAMDIWFQFLRTQIRTPEWFWKGPTKKKDPPIKDWKIMAEFHNMEMDDVYMLCELFPKDVKAEIERIKEIQKETEAA